MNAPMNVLRVWRTVRHLTTEQWLYRAICRGRRGVMQAFPGTARRRLQKAADALPQPDTGSDAVVAIGRIVLGLQQAVHGNHPSGAAAGRFTLLGQEFDFGSVAAIDWRGEFHEGNNPLRRMNLAYMGYAVPLLSHGRISDLKAMVEILQSLEAQNHFAARGVFRDVWNAYTASHRLINLLSGLALYRAAGGELDEAAETVIYDHARLCAAFIAGNLERDLQYNHLLKNLVALSVFSAAIGAVPPAFAFLDTAIVKSVRQNVLGDGGPAERCPMYHALSVLDLEMLSASGIVSRETETMVTGALARMKPALAVMSHPDGDIALFNDSWLGEAPASRDIISFAAGDGVSRLRDTGYVRLGAGGDAIIFDCGPCGPDDNPGHAHADFLSIEASIGGERFIVDPGVPTYTAGVARDASRSAAAHNGPHIVGAEPIEFWKSFRVGRRGMAWELTDDRLDGIAPIWCAGVQNGYALLGGEVRRFVGLWPGQALLIADLWIGASGHEAASHFLIPNSWSLAAGRDAAFRQGATHVRLSCFAGKIADINEGTCWPRFGVEQKAHRVVVRPGPGDGFQTAALWIAWSADSSADSLADAPEPTPETLAHLLDTLRVC
jgi:hypothetical protein